ncbi:MAG: hypothetical protein FJ360_00075 [Thaumarchaeota archaeon]|nr:hypothetical protein [Nitrososphaerota archaeon]
MSVAVFLLFATNFAYAQQPQLATFQEISQVIVDQKLSNNVTASITLQTTSNQEIRIPSELERKILDTDGLVAVVVTSEERCVLGIEFDSCILINISREGIEGDIIAIQDRAKEVGNSLIDELNTVLDTDARFHSVFVHYEDSANVALGTSGAVSGRGTVSAVYTMSKEDTASMYEKLTAILLPQVIRESGGFYNTAKNLASQPNAKMTFSILPQNQIALYQIKLTVDYPNSADDVERVDPLKFLMTEKLERSNYFSQGFYPLNSLFQLVVLTQEPLRVEEVNSKIIPTVLNNGEKFPEDITQKGWSFISESGDKIEAMYLFGKDFAATKDELVLILTSADSTEPIKENIAKSGSQEIDLSQIYIIVGIVAAAAVAIAFYLKGFRAKH